jgi:hypothetical protein
VKTVFLDLVFCSVWWLCLEQQFLFVATDSIVLD